MPDGSYIARMWRIFDFRFSYYPPLWAALALVSAVYVNFFTQHFTRDLAPQVEEWQMVSLTKLIAWFLLLMLSFVLVSLVHRPRIAARPSARASVLVRVSGP